MILLCLMTDDFSCHDGNLKWVSEQNNLSLVNQFILFDSSLD